MTDDRRRSPRINLITPLSGQVGPQEQPVEVCQMSLGGMLIKTSAALSPLGLHEFRLAFDEEVETVVSGQVVHSRYAVQEGALTYTLGIAFGPLPDRAHDTVRRFVTALQERSDL